jgi:hypothetical protein
MTIQNAQDAGTMIEPRRPEMTDRPDPTKGEGRGRA